MLLSIARSPLADWTLNETLRELGFGNSIDAGDISISESGTVAVRSNSGGLSFESTIQTPDDLQKLFKALGQTSHPNSPPISGSSRRVLDVLAHTRASRFANRVNNRMWYGVKFKTALRPEFRMGQRFELPMVELKPGRGELVRVKRDFPELDALKAFFLEADGTMHFPIHPQELELRNDPNAQLSYRSARCASSERTLHVGIPDAPNVLVKLDLANIKHSGVFRPIEAGAVHAAMAITDFLADWVDAHGQGDTDPFCFLPEITGVVDKEKNAAAIVRSTTPYPPLNPPQRSWVMPMYSLIAKDQDFPDEAPPLIRMINARPDQELSEAEYFAEAFLKPVIGSLMRVHLDLGSSAQAHGQNTFLEVGEDGQPTGRVPHSDLEAFWPHPEVAAATGREEFFRSYGFVHNPQAKESKVYQTFKSYFESQNLRPLMKAFATHFPGQKSLAQRLCNTILREEVLKRKDLIESVAPLKNFSRYWS